MEVIHLILGKANPERMNGVNRVVFEMASNQLENGYRVQVWGITRFPKHDYPARKFSTSLYMKWRNPFRPDPVLLKDLREKRDDIVVHIHGAFIPVFYSVSSFLARNKIPFIITPHSTYNKVMMRKNALIKKIYFKLFEKGMLDRAYAIHLLGKSEWEGLEAIYHNRKSKIIPYGFSQLAPAVNVVKYPVFSICYCGRLSIYTKGLDILLNGFALFNRLNPAAELVIIGDGKERPKLKQICTDLKIRSAVKFRGSVFGEEKVSIISACHVFAHPSRSDGMPATIVEAASLGIPCIVSDATNMGDFIEHYDAGWLLQENTPEALCNGLKNLKARLMKGNDPELLRRNALLMIREVFAWKKILSQFNQIYKNAFVKKISITEKIHPHKNLMLKHHQ